MNAWLKTRSAVKSEKYIELKRQIQSDKKAMRKEIVKVFYPELIKT